MTLNVLNLKTKSYLSENSRFESLDYPNRNLALVQAQSQLGDPKVNKRLTLLDINWYKVKNERIIKRHRLREHHSFVHSEKTSHERIPTRLLGKYNEQVKSGVIDKYPSLCTSNANSEVSLEKMIQDYQIMHKEFSLDIRENSLISPSPDHSLHKDQSHQSKVSSLHLDVNELSESKITPPQSAFQSYRTSDKLNTLNKFRMKTKSRNKSASTHHSIDHSPQGVVRNKENTVRQRTESGSKPLRNRHQNKQSSKEDINKTSSALFIPLDTIESEQAVDQQTQKRAKSASVLLSANTNSPTASSQIFVERTVFESNVPLRAVRYVKGEETSIFGPNQTLLAKPLQLPLTQLMQKTLKKIDERFSQPKKSKKKSLISEYEKSLLQNTYSEYFHEINPMGSRLKNEEFEVLNTMNQNFRAKRGLNNGVNTAKITKNKDEEKPYKLISELKQAYKDNQNPDKILKDYRKDMPIKMGRKFLESSFNMRLKRIPDKDTVNGKIKNYDAWYVPAEDRFKRYNGVFDHSNYSRRYFKNYPKETINPESIQKITKGEIKSY